MDTHTEAQVQEKVSSSSSPDNLLSQAKAAAERIEAANKVQEELIKRNEELISRQILGGGSEAGMNKKQETNEERIDREIDMIMKPRGFDPLAPFRRK